MTTPHCHTRLKLAIRSRLAKGISDTSVAASRVPPVRGAGPPETERHPSRAASQNAGKFSARSMGVPTEEFTPANCDGDTTTNSLDPSDMTQGRCRPERSLLLSIELTVSSPGPGTAHPASPHYLSSSVVRWMPCATAYHPPTQATSSCLLRVLYPTKPGPPVLLTVR